MMFSSSSSLYLILLLGILTTDAYGEETAALGRRQNEAVHNLIEWLKSAGGFLDSRVEIRRLDPEDPNSYFGVFANAPIKYDEKLITIPGGLKLQIADNVNDWGYAEQICELSWMLKEEFEKGDESKYLAWINFLRTQAEGQIPGAWSSAGQDLLLKVHGDLPVNGSNVGNNKPAAMVNWLESFANKECAVGGQTLNPHFIAMTVQRGFDSVLVPIMDMFNHSNHPDKVNIILDTSIFGKHGFTIHASRDPKAGEELYFAYRDTMSDWGTPEILRDFGFVEGYPQRFLISDDVTIIVDQVEIEDGKLDYVVSFVDEICPDSFWIKEKVKALMALEESLSDEAATNSEVPASELAVIREYHNALLVAFSGIASQCTDV